MSWNKNVINFEYFLHYFDGGKFQLCAFCAQILAQIKLKPKNLKTSDNFRSSHTWLFLSENHFWAFYSPVKSMYQIALWPLSEWCIIVIRVLYYDYFLNWKEQTKAISAVSAPFRICLNLSLIPHPRKSAIRLYYELFFCISQQSA